MMPSLRSLRAYFLFAFIVISLHALGKGGGSEVGNGGSVILLPNDKVVLADPYIPRTDDHEIGELSPYLVTEIQRAGAMLVRVGADVADTTPKIPLSPEFHVMHKLLSRAGQAEFVTTEVLDPKVEYHFVDKLPEKECVSANDVGPTDPGAKEEMAACTEGPVTWILKDVFQKMSVRDQTKLILHERMHVLKYRLGFPHSFIIDVTSGLETLLELYNAQSSGARPVLSAVQIHDIEVLIKRLVQTGIRSKSTEDEMEFKTAWTVSPRGGGLVHSEAKVSDSAYIGAGSLLGAGSYVGDRSTLLNVMCHLANCQIDSDATLIDVSFEPGFLDQYAVAPMRAAVGRHALLFDSKFSGSAILRKSGPSELHLGEGAAIAASSISGIDRMSVESQSSLQSIALVFAINPGNTVDFTLSPRSRLANGMVSFIVPLSLSSQDLRVSVIEGHQIDFKQAPICPNGQYLFLKKSVEVQDGAGLGSLCAASFTR